MSRITKRKLLRAFYAGGLFIFVGINLAAFSCLFGDVQCAKISGIALVVEAFIGCVIGAYIGPPGLAASSGAEEGK